MKKNKNVIILVKSIVTMALLYFLFNQFDFAQVIENLKRIPIWSLPLSLFLQFICIAFASLRFICLIPNTKGRKLDLVKLSFMAFSANNFLPSGIGGDVLKVVMLKNLSRTSRFWLMVTDKTIGVFTSAIAGFYFLLVNSHKISNKWADTLYIFCLLIIIASLVVLFLGI